DRRGAGGEPAREVQEAAGVQPAVEPDRAVLEGAAAAGDPQPAVRHAGRPEALRSRQPHLLPHPAGPRQAPPPGGSQKEEGKADRISERVNEETARYLGIALGTLRNWTSAHYIPFVKKGRIVRYHRLVIDRWLAKGACRGRATLADV